jgi:hypothetical protein
MGKAGSGSQMSDKYVESFHNYDTDITLGDVPMEHRTREVCIAAIKRHPANVELVPEHMAEEMNFVAAVALQPENFELHKDKFSEEIQRAAIEASMHTDNGLFRLGHLFTPEQLLAYLGDLPTLDVAFCAGFDRIASDPELRRLFEDYLDDEDRGEFEEEIEQAWKAPSV